MTTNAVTTALSAVVAILAFAITAFAYRRTRLESLKLELEFRRFEFERAEKSESSLNVESASEIQASSVRLQSAVDMLSSYMAEIRRELDQVTTAVTNNVTHLYTGDGRSEDREAEAGNSYAVISELSHALRTPLAHLASRTNVLRRELSGTDPRFIPELDEMRASVDMCTDTLTAYQEMARLSTDSGSWRATDLDRSLGQIFAMYERENGKNLEFVVDAPGEVPGYNNGYILAMLTPLIQNAIEAAPAESTIALEFSRSADNSMLYITVANEVDARVDISAFEERGRSSKVGHSGLGVSISRRLATAQAGGGIRYGQQGEKFFVTATLPVRTS